MASESGSPEFIEIDPERVFALFRTIGFAPPHDPADGDRPGLAFAGRAEIKLATVRPGDPLGVSSAIPAESKEFFRLLAEHSGQLQVITDPTGTYVFERGQAMEHLPHPEPEPAAAPEPARPATAAPARPWWKLW
jgi:hypothetical protein